MVKVLKNQKRAKANPQKPVKKTLKPSKIDIKEIDADGQVLGRLATQVANFLRGKGKPEFRPNMMVGDKVIVKNARKIIITGNKLEQKIYYHHTGYLGHLKSESLKDLMAKNPAEVVKRAVYGMLPKNKLRKQWLRNLEVKNDN